MPDAVQNFPVSPALATAGSAEAGQGPWPWPLEIRFSGSGSEYFRIWIVNLLLILVTLGIYYPWAKVRRLRYFYSNTWLGNAAIGRYALDFHGAAGRMLVGYLIMGVLFVVYSVSVDLSPLAGGVALSVLALVAPVLFRAGLRFRLANTSWRGLRFGFSGTLGGAYRVFLPLGVPAAVFVAATVAGLPADEPDPQAPDGSVAAMRSGVALLASLAAAYLMAPWIWFRMRRYQHDHYGFGGIGSRLVLGPGAVYRLLFKAAGVSLAALAAALIVALALAWMIGAATGFASGSAPTPGADLPTGLPVFVATLLPMLMVLVPLGLIVAFQFVVVPYLVARQQDLFWSSTRSAGIRFSSALGVYRLARLTAWNWLMTLLTLGLYRPFAAIATARLRLEAVGFALRDDPDLIVGSSQLQAKGAAGDAAGDLFDLDIGL